MKKRIIQTALAAAVLIAAALVISTLCKRRKETSHGSVKTMHMPVPDFTIADLAGRPVSPRDLRGRVLILDFWATWCGPCKNVIPRLNALQNKYESSGLRVIGISLDDEPAPVRKFYSDMKMNYPVVMGDVKLAERFGGVLGLPVAFIVGCDGMIEARYSGETDIHAVEKDVRRLIDGKDCQVQRKPS
ncbi:MAG: TlpA family protein disulfide reductase [Spirochaetia bacterium]|nr:TlpA family protein disulfide reductase [Spirochaetia bacterium]